MRSNVGDNYTGAEIMSPAHKLTILIFMARRKCTNKLALEQVKVPFSALSLARQGEREASCDN